MKDITYQEVLTFLQTPQGQLLQQALKEAEGLSLKGLKEIRTNLANPNLIIITDTLIRERERQTAWVTTQG